MKIGFIGFGEAAYEMGKGLHDAGSEEILAYDIMLGHETYGPLIRERAENSFVKIVSTEDEVLYISDVVIVAVPSDKSLQTAKGLKHLLNDSKIYVDVSASTPEVKRNIWKEIIETGVSFVDAAMLGPLPVYQHKVPTLISGNGSDQFIKLMQPYGMDLEKISDIPGDATGVKLVRSIYMKGLPALFVEVLKSAKKMKIEPLVLKSIAKTMDECPFESTFNRLVTGTAVHAERRAHEMKNVIEMLENINIQPTMSKASYEILSWLASKNLKNKFGGKTPNGWKEVIEAWEQE